MTKVVDVDAPKRATTTATATEEAAGTYGRPSGAQSGAHLVVPMLEARSRPRSAMAQAQTSRPVSILLVEDNEEDILTRDDLHANGYIAESIDVFWLGVVGLPLG